MRSAWFLPLAASLLFCLGRAGIVEGAESGAGPARGRSPGGSPWPRHSLRVEKSWQLNLPKGQGFDASGLLMTPTGELLTVNDRGSTIYAVRFLTDTNAADLNPVGGLFTESQLAPFKGSKTGRYDTEGIAQDALGRIYVCEEADRWVLRFDPANGTVTRLPIDWSPVRKFFNPVDRNASFEGIAVGPDRIYVANERQVGRIIAVDLETLRVVDDFAVHAHGVEAWDVHYSDLSWFDGALWVLLRESRCVLQVDPKSHRVLAEYSFRELEQAPDAAYVLLYPTGNMEGLAVDRDWIWLVTDNNGQPRIKHPKDSRPTLFKCRRPTLK